MGRVVLTHSTHIKGLIDILKKLAKNYKIKSITPSVLSKTRSNSPKLKIKLTRKTIGGFKLVARKGSQAQEIYITTKLNESDLLKELESILN
ncbi:DUF2103 domain-containing protein [Prochlorococcus marinus]|uniref:Metal-binding protein n=1 Tax=Prochlorococcus marinus (strain MIT 9211) TaxID=93059 RepID=A9BAA9_PROM4|nr:DUF2103 domain-containing protein [Prochlorococcus marinus]ABX08771.1 conserved hypothetical protein [Prochlorococcus marinus str. MIT 9211]